MHRALTPRKLTAAGWGVLVLILAVCAWGIRLTTVQRRNIGSTLLELHRQSAETRLLALERQLDEKEQEILSALATAGSEPAPLATLVLRELLVAEPFFIGSDGQLELPLLGEVRATLPLVSDEPPPPEFEQALMVACSSAPLEEKVQTLEDIHESQGMASRWRLRALATVAALRARDGKTSLALSDYGVIFDEFAPLLRSFTHPSYLQLVLARNECLIQAGRDAEAREAVLGVLDEIRSGASSSTLDEEAFFLSRVRSLLPGSEDRLEAARRALDHKRLSGAVATALHDEITARGRLDHLPAKGAHPLYFHDARFPVPWESGTGGISRPGVTRPVFAVWRHAGGEASGKSRAALGYRVVLAELESRLTEWMARLAPGDGLVVRVSVPKDDGDLVTLATLSGQRSFIEIGFERAAWADKVGDAQKPFVLAAVLIGCLAVILTLGLLAFLRAVRKEVKLARMKTEFVANVSHELKTPLALIRLFGETLLLERVPDGARRKKYYQIITRESERLAHLIANVLNFASIDAGKKSYEMLPCQLDDVVHETYESYRHHLEEKGFAHSLVIDDDIPQVVADRDAIAQAVINLLENAVKYSPHEREVTLRVTYSDSAVRISVSDRGVGISREDQLRVWEDFYRARQARTLATRGSGLGLSMVRHLVESHGGWVELESTPGGGSTFSMVFPLPDSKDSLPAGGEDSRGKETGDPEEISRLSGRGNA